SGAAAPAPPCSCSNAEISQLENTRTDQMLYKWRSCCSTTYWASSTAGRNREPFGREEGRRNKANIDPRRRACCQGEGLARIIHAPRRRECMNRFKTVELHDFRACRRTRSPSRPRRSGPLAGLDYLLVPNASLRDFLAAHHRQLPTSARWLLPSTVSG